MCIRDRGGTVRKFNNEFLQRVKDSTNLIDVIRAYGIDVKKKGSKSWACCPFHHEKTPSFAISPEDGFYYCFGCHESGDSIKFIEKMENVKASSFARIMNYIADEERLWDKPIDELDWDVDSSECDEID